MAKNKASNQPEEAGTPAQPPTPDTEPSAQTEAEGGSVKTQEPTADAEPTAEEVAVAARAQLQAKIGQAKLTELEEKGFDISLIIELAALAPEVAQLVRRVIDIIRRPRPAPVYRATHHPTEDDLIEQVLCNALCAAHGALQLKGHKH